MVMPDPLDALFPQLRLPPLARFQSARCPVSGLRYIPNLECVVTSRTPSTLDHSAVGHLAYPPHRIDCRCRLNKLIGWRDFPPTID